MGLSLIESLTVGVLYPQSAKNNPTPVKLGCSATDSSALSLSSTNHN